MIYAITGKTYVGKTTLAEKLANHLKYRMVSFGDGPRELVTIITGINDLRRNKNLPLPDAWLGGSARLGREAIIQVAQAMKPIFGDDVWAKYLLLHSNHNIVIDDLRFVSEYDVLKNFKHRIIRVVCEEEDRFTRASKFGDPEELIAAGSPGELEINLIPADYTINTSFPVDIEKIIRWR